MGGRIGEIISFIIFILFVALCITIIFNPSPALAPVIIPVVRSTRIRASQAETIIQRLQLTGQAAGQPPVRPSETGGLRYRGYRLISKLQASLAAIQAVL